MFNVGDAASSLVRPLPGVEADVGRGAPPPDTPCSGLVGTLHAFAATLTWYPSREKGELPEPRSLLERCECTSHIAVTSL